VRRIIQASPADTTEPPKSHGIVGNTSPDNLSPTVDSRLNAIEVNIQIHGDDAPTGMTVDPSTHNVYIAHGGHAAKSLFAMDFASHKVTDLPWAEALRVWHRPRAQRPLHRQRPRQHGVRD
jgi:hypothetical protein